MTNKKNKLRCYKKGVRAEKIAAFWLMLKGYKILSRRYKTKLGEIDIIAKKGNLIAIIEVKYRYSVTEAMQAIGYYNEIRIERASDLWLARRKDRYNLSLRYDLIIISPWRFPKHIKAIFLAKNK
ncbi:YraN family protein [Bartonella sp. DGB1]|uniref:YraN family protein n=1 Tax=Bartonella sp. DGB1 TaxID=3239807 RepID=UPI00352449D2